MFKKFINWFFYKFFKNLIEEVQRNTKIDLFGEICTFDEVKIVKEDIFDKVFTNTLLIVDTKIGELYIKDNIFQKSKIFAAKANGLNIEKNKFRGLMHESTIELIKPVAVQIKDNVLIQ